MIFKCKDRRQARGKRKPLTRNLAYWFTSVLLLLRNKKVVTKQEEKTMKCKNTDKSCVQQELFSKRKSGSKIGKISRSGID